jgi:hypothetical protein
MRKHWRSEKANSKNCANPSGCAFLRALPPFVSILYLKSICFWLFPSCESTCTFLCMRLLFYVRACLGTQMD